jgi:beta-galactosidase
VDTCGFPKDFYYYYRAWWRPEPSLYVFPHWNWPGRQGQEIPVWVYSNLDEVELFVNGTSLGIQKVPHLGHVAWKARYEPGAIAVRGWKDGKVVLTHKRETTGEPESLRLTADRIEINADGEDIAILKVEALDARGRLASLASNELAFRVSGQGVLIGVGNGNPNCQESDKEPRRSLFHGLAQVILQSTTEPGVIQVEAMKDRLEGPQLQPARLSITTRRAQPRPTVPIVQR